MDASNASSRHIAGRARRGSGESRRPLGEILVELGFVSRAQLDSALDVQRTTGGRIGEILVDQGCLTRLDLASALAEHWEPYPSTDAGDGLESGRRRTVGSRPAAEPEAPPHLAG